MNIMEHGFEKNVYGDISFLLEAINARKSSRDGNERNARRSRRAAAGAHPGIGSMSPSTDILANVGMSHK